jgi:uncharacterized Zn-finger protein
VCKKTLPGKKALSRHMSGHLETKPYSCSICTKSYVERGALKRHMKTHSCMLCYKLLPLLESTEEKSRRRRKEKSSSLCSECKLHEAKNVE